MDYVIVKIVLVSEENFKTKLEEANKAIKDNNSPVTVEGFPAATPVLGKCDGFESKNILGVRF